MNPIRKILHPELFQGGMRHRWYFEGWYFKLIDRNMATAAAVIPGIALGSTRGSPDSHAFVQFIVGQKAAYHRYPLSAFQSDSSKFLVRIGENTFSRKGVSLRLGSGEERIEGDLAFAGGLPFPSSAMWPGVMGPFGFVPGMECYHGVVSFRHGISGTLAIGGSKVTFDGGSGYVEKDWGRSFPSCWIWLQANHFPGDASFLLSVADIPWLGSSFVGFFAYLYHRGRFHRFATYTGAKIARLIEAQGATQAVLTGKGHRLEVTARPGAAGFLKAPKNGLMDRLIEETITATVEVRLTDGQGGVLFEGTSPCAGMERYEPEALLGRVGANR